jgi:DNA repair protein RecO (recombination protein O)
MNDDYTKEHRFLDLQEGIFVSHQPTHPNFLTDEKAELTSWFLKAMHPNDLEQFKLNHNIRRQMLLHYQHYYALHIHDFGQMKTLQVLQEVLI